MTSKERPFVPPHRNGLPTHSHQASRNNVPVTKGIRPEGESGRRGFHPFKFIKICLRSSCFLSRIVNILWPFVPAAFAYRYARNQDNLWNFILPYIAIVPAANLLGFAGQEFSRKLPHTIGVVTEITFGSIVEIILFMVLIRHGPTAVPIIQAAILGSLLANLLLCLGFCFFAGGLRRDEQEFHEAVSEVGSNLMLVAGMGLVIPAIFANALGPDFVDRDRETLRISRGAALVLFAAYIFFIVYQTRSHKGLYDELLAEDEAKDADKHKDLRKAKLTMTESIIAIIIAIAIVSCMAVYLVERIEVLIKERNIKEAFLGLILVPLVEKAAEHITAVDEAWDNQMNFALSHVLGASIQTALFNTPLVVFVGWGMGIPMHLNFNPFEAIVLVLAIIVVGNFMRDKKSNYLEGALCVLVYIIIAITAFFYPNPNHAAAAESGGH